MGPSTSRIDAVDEGASTAPTSWSIPGSTRCSTSGGRRSRSRRSSASIALTALLVLVGASSLDATPVSASAPVVARPTATPATEAGRFIAVGDSILLGARAQLDSRLRFLGWPAVLDLEVSRSTSKGADVLESHHPGPADVVVISLGANDSGDPALFRARAERVADAGADAAAVYWLTIAEVRAYYPGTNEIIRELAGRYPNLAVVDWAEVAGSEPSLTARDGLHLTPTGTVAMADEIFGAVMGIGSGDPEPDELKEPDPEPDDDVTSSGPGEAAASASTTVTTSTPSEQRSGSPGAAASSPSTVPVERLRHVVDDAVGPLEDRGSRRLTVGLVVGAVIASAGVVTWAVRRRRGNEEHVTSHSEEETEHQKT